MLRVAAELVRLSMVENLSSLDLSEAKKVKEMEIVQVVGMGNIVYPIVPHTHGVVNPAVCLGLSGILFPAVHPAGSQIDGKNQGSQYEYQYISCFHGGKDSAN